MFSFLFQQVKAYVSREKALPFMPLIGIVYLLTLNENWNPTWDSAIYITLGKSLISGDGFKYMGYPHTKYPPIFPLLLSPIIGLFGDNFFLMRLVIVVMALGSVWLTYVLIKRISNDKFLAIFVMLSTAVSYPLFFECTRILSDIPYYFFSFGTLIFAEQYALDEHKAVISKKSLLTIVFLLLSYFTRLIGLALFAGIVSCLIIEGCVKGISKLKIKKSVFIGIVFILFSTMWMIHNYSVRVQIPNELRESLSYERELISVDPNNPYSETIGLKDLAVRISAHTDYYTWLLGSIVLGKRIDNQWLAACISLFLLSGFINCLFKRRTVAEYYTFFYCLILLVWTSTQGERFLLPIIPFIFYYFFKTAEFFFLLISLCFPKRITSIFPRVSLAIVTLLLISGNIASDIKIIKTEHKEPYYSSKMTTFLELIDWIKENTPIETTIVCDRAPYVYLLANRKTFSFPRVQNPQEVVESIDRNHADYVVYSSVGGYAEKYLRPAIEEYANRFSVIYRKGDAIIYKIQR